MPPEGKKKLEDLAAALIEHANRLGGRLHPIVATSIADRVRSMNCYYSNLIEGHDTYPVDIERALKSEFSADPGRRILQLEATYISEYPAYRISVTLFLRQIGKSMKLDLGQSAF